MKHMRLIGDCCHALSVLTFFWLVRWKGNAAGVSLHSQQLYLLVFVLRYMDLFTSFYSIYNTGMKVILTVFTAWIVFAMRYYEPAKATYLPLQDAVPGFCLAVSAIVFGTLIHLLGNGVVDINGGSGEDFQVHFDNYSWREMLWTISICLEPLAMIPQLYIFFKNRLIAKEIRIALFLNGIYRCFYILHWIHLKRHGTTDLHLHVLVSMSSCLQILVYLDFFIYHFSIVLLRCIQGYAAASGDVDAIASDSGIALGDLKSSEVEDLLDTYPRKKPTKAEIQKMTGMQYI